MQVNSIGSIDLIFIDDKIININVLQDFTKFSYFTRLITERKVTGKCTKPIAFIWHDSHLRPITPKLIKWINEEFKPLFEYDGLKWFASVDTCCPELRPYLEYNTKEPNVI